MSSGSTANHEQVSSTHSQGGPCGACKFLRRKCFRGCVFAPYFEASEEGTAHFAAVHKVFGASTASKLLLRLPPQKRLDAVVTLCYEALARVRDPVYGCVAHIFTLQQQSCSIELQRRLSSPSIEDRLPIDPTTFHCVRLLDRAAYITEQDDMTRVSNESQAPDPWHLCTVTQVEEVKCVLRILPIWVCTIFGSVVFIQMLSLFEEQGAAMNRRVSKNFSIPPASMTAFDIVSTTLFIVLYDRLILPLYIKATKREPNPPNELQRIRIGLTIAVIALVIAGFVERLRLKHASSTGETSSLSIFWQTPQYVLVGISDAFVYIAKMEFFASQMPDGMKSLGMALSMFSSSIESYIVSILLAVVMKITTRNGEPGWVPPNLNEGHLDRFFFLSAGLTALNLAFYVVCAKRYKYISEEKKEEGTS